MGRASVVRGPGGFSGGALALDAPETIGDLRLWGLGGTGRFTKRPSTVWW